MCTRSVLPSPLPTPLPLKCIYEVHQSDVLSGVECDCSRERGDFVVDPVVVDYMAATTKSV